MMRKTVGNVLVMKLGNGNTMTCHRADGAYENITSMSAQICAQAHPRELVATQCLCSAAALDQHIDGGANLDTEILIMEKRAVTAETIIPQDGVNPLTIPSDEIVVVTTNPTP